jgi:hypothetical protein
VRGRARLPVGREPLEADQPPRFPRDDPADLELAFEDMSARATLEALPVAEERRLQLLDERVERRGRLERDLDEDADRQPATASRTRSGMSKFA